MHAVVNKLALAKPFDEQLLGRVKRDLLPRMSQRPGFLELKVVRVSDEEVVLLVFFETREALDELSREIAGPWFAEHVRPYLAGPVQRSVGEVMVLPN